MHVALCCAVTQCFSCFCFLNREEDKNIFDYCKENNIDYVTKAIQSKKVDVNVADEEVWIKKIFLKKSLSCFEDGSFPLAF